MNAMLIEIFRQKKAVILVILALIVLNLVLMFLIASYQEPALAASISKWSELRNIVARAGRGDAVAKYHERKVELEKLNSRIPLKREFGRVLSDIYEAASDSGVTTGLITYKPAAIKNESLFLYELSFSVSGDYGSIKSYLSDLLQNQEFIVVDSVSLANTDLYIENVVMNLSVTVYLREGA